MEDFVAEALIVDDVKRIDADKVSGKFIEEIQQESVVEMVIDPCEIVVLYKNEKGGKKRLLVNDERTINTRRKSLVEKPAKRKLIQPNEYQTAVIELPIE